MRNRFFALIKELTLGSGSNLSILNDLSFQQAQRVRKACDVCRDNRLLIRNDRMPKPCCQFNDYGGHPERKHTMPHRPIQNRRDDPAVYDSRIPFKRFATGEHGCNAAIRSRNELQLQTLEIGWTAHHAIRVNSIPYVVNAASLQCFQLLPFARVSTFCSLRMDILIFDIDQHNTI